MFSAPLIITVGSMNEADSGGAPCGQTGRFCSVGWKPVPAVPVHANTDPGPAVMAMGTVTPSTVACLIKPRRLIFLMVATPFFTGADHAPLDVIRQFHKK